MNNEKIKKKNIVRPKNQNEKTSHDIRNTDCMKCNTGRGFMGLMKQQCIKISYASKHTM